MDHASAELSLHEFGRVNLRMHNKLLVSDNTFAVTGGRNIADEYFMRGRTSNFIDLDLLASGPILRELSDLFDRFWTSEQSVPIEALGPAEAARIPETPGKPLESKADDGLLREFEHGRVELRFAPLRQPYMKNYKIYPIYTVDKGVEVSF